jgi:N-acetylmuramoyl-L-alanine amidase
MRISCLVLTLFLGLASQVDAQQTYKVRKVVLDAGHGGKDPGCHGHHSKEKEVALNITLELGKKIEAAFPDVDVIYTRTKDVFIALNERAAIANRNKADLFMSIHCNYIGARNKASGTETFVMGLHRADDNLDVAKRENASILLEEDFEKTYEGFDPYSAEGHIILSMFQNAHLQQSIMLANNIESSFKKLCQLPSRGVKQAGFLVLRETTMPSVLIETGFLSTDADENFLMKEENQHKVAEAIFRAFSNYKKEVEDHQAELLEASTASEPPKELQGEIKKDNPPAITKPVAQKTEVKTTSAANTENKTTPAVKAEVVEKPAVKSDPEKLVYRIQIAAASKPNLDARYHSLKDLEVIKEYELYKFVVGKYSTKEEAMPRLTALRADGYTGCFIVAYKEGQRIRA